MKTCTNNSIRIWRPTPVAQAIGYGGRYQEEAFSLALTTSDTGNHPETMLDSAEAASR